jgi:hypothetical protein
MTKIAALVFLSIVFLSSPVNGAGCTEQATAMAETAAKEWEKAKNNMQSMLPEPSDYSKQVKDCLGSLGNWGINIGFKIPSIDDILRKWCDEIRSHIELPDLDFNLSEQLGIGTHTLYEVDHRKEAEDVFAYIWQQVWGG